MLRRLTINAEQMRMAFEDHDGEGRWFLDTETGAVVRREAGIAERYLAIPYQGALARRRDIAEFIGLVSDNKLRALLDAGGPARFESVLQAFPDELERWRSFQTFCAHHRIRRWLASENIEIASSSHGARMRGQA